MSQGRGGGPKTADGKLVASKNAVKHGLTAMRHLPEILRDREVDSIFAALCDEWKLNSPTARFHLREVARHQAALTKIEVMEEAVLRRGAHAALLLLEDADYDLVDAALAGAGTSEAIERLTRYRRTHERAIGENGEADSAWALNGTQSPTATRKSNGIGPKPGVPDGTRTSGSTHDQRPGPVPDGRATARTVGRDGGGRHG